MKQNPDFSHTEQRKTRIKMAQHLLNMRAIEQEMGRYNVHSLQKMAAVGAGREQRIKYAALLRQYELEKQAFITGLARLAGRGLMGAGKMLGRGAMGATKGLGQMGAGAVKGAVRGARSSYGLKGPFSGGSGTLRETAKQLWNPKNYRGMGNRFTMRANHALGLPQEGAKQLRQQAMRDFGNNMLQTAGGALRGSAQGMAQAARANPMNALLGAGALGLGAGTQLPAMYQGAQNMGNQAMQGMQQAGQGTQNYMSNVGNSAMQGMQNVGNAVGQAGMDMYNTATAPIQNAGRQMGDAVGSAYGGARNFMTNMMGAGRDIMRNLNTGIQQAGRRFR